MRILSLLSLILCTFSIGVFGQEETTIKYIGSSTVGKYINDAAKVYTDAHFIINTKPESGSGENATAACKADIGGVARDVKQSILAKGVEKYLIGKDAIGIIVHEDNPITSLTLDQLKQIFTGQVTNWNEVGGPDLAISVYIVNPQSATRKVFAQVVLGDADYAGDSLETIRPDKAILDKVKENQGAIGHLNFALIGETAGVKRIQPNGEAASTDNVSYPITRPLYLITKGEASGKEKAFIDWTLGADGQAIVKRYFVGVE